MKLKKQTLFLLSFMLGGVVWAQKPEDTLVTINDSIYKVSDFERLYNKNIDIITDESQKDVLNYFELYKLYKIKLQEAYKRGLDKKENIKQEYQTYRKELAEKYFVDVKALDKLVNEAVNRANFEINASHILVAVDEFASANDTLMAYNKAIEIRNQIENGLSFEAAAEKYSADLSAKTNHGNLGYFSVFKMVYPFETGAYNTNVGAVSMPVRSNFGYHLIKVINKRPTSNTKTIAHILIETKNTNAADSKKKIDAIYEKLQKGQNFDDLAFHLSDDIYTRDKYGALGVYTEGSFDIKGISDVVYNLNYQDAYSKPFLSQYGWHIIRVTSIKEKPSHDVLYASFLQKIKTDNRSKIAEQDLIHHLKEMYKLTVNEENVLKTAEILDRENMMLNPKVEENEKNNMVLATYKDKKIISKNLLESIYTYPLLYSEIKTDKLLVEKAFDDYVLRMLKKQYDDDLETNFPEFAQTMKEYKEGLLLFNLLETQIWQPVAEDTLALQAFYKENKANYNEKPYFIGEIYVFDKKDYANSFQRALNGRYPVKEEDFPIVYKYQGTFYFDDKRLPTNLNEKTLGKKTVDFNKKHYVFKVRSIKPEQFATFDKVKSKVQSDYQNQFENNFNKKLLEKAQIKVNEPVLNLLTKKYAKKSLN